MIRYLPLIGELPNSSKKSVTSALKELIFSTLASTVPIWFFPTITKFFITTDRTFLQDVYLSVAHGDLYMFAFALVGPLIFAITADYTTYGDDNISPGASQIGKLTFLFPYGTWFLGISLSIWLLAGLCFILIRLTDNGDIFAKLNNANLLNFSIFMYIFSLFCLFCVLVYRNELSDVGFKERDGTNEFLKKWNGRGASDE